MMVVWNKLRIVFTLLWVMICSATLWWFVNHPKAWSDPEITVLYILVMLTISFPIGIVYWSILSMLAVVIPNPNLGREIELVVVWIGFVAIGYVQWAILVPWGYRKFREALKTRKTEL